MPDPTGSFVWYELMTPDPDGAAAFYERVVGWKIAGERDPEAAGGVDYRHIVRADGGANGGVLALTPAMLAEGARPGWFGYLSVADVDAAVEAIVADGGKSLMPAFDLDVGRIALIADPQGIPSYLMKPIPPSGREDARSDVFDPDEVQRFAWNELITPDLAAAKAFYARHFGFTFDRSMPMGELGDYCFVDHGGRTIGAMMQKPPEMPTGSWNLYVRVADLDAAIAAIAAGGGRVTNGPMDVPGGDRVLSGVDPQGASFALVAHARDGDSPND